MNKYLIALAAVGVGYYLWTRKATVASVPGSSIIPDGTGVPAGADNLVDGHGTGCFWSQPMQINQALPDGVTVSLNA